MKRNKNGTFKKDTRGRYNKRTQMVINKPKVPVLRYLVMDERHIKLDLRGIRNPHRPMEGRLNPTKGGQKRFLSPEHLQCMVNEYFESCNGPKFDRKGNLVYDNQGNLVKTQVKPYTVSGLALYLGVSTNTLKKYREGAIDSLLDEMLAETDDRLTFSKVVLRAKQVIESSAEERLYDGGSQRGAQFVLDCCFGWVTHREQSDINRAKADTKLRREEFELKKQAIDNVNEDDNFTINIVRGKRE